MSFWSKKTQVSSNQNHLKTSLDYLNKLNDVLAKLDSSIITTQANTNSIDLGSNLASEVSESNSPIIAGSLNYNNYTLAIGLNKDLNCDVVYSCIDEISKCLVELKRMILDTSGSVSQDSLSGTDFSSSRMDSTNKTNSDNSSKDSNTGKSNQNGSGGSGNKNSIHGNAINSSVQRDLSTGFFNSENIYDVFFKNDLFIKLLLKFPILDFESKKNISILFTNGFGKCIDNKFVYVDYMSSRTDTISLLLIILENTTQTLSNSVEIYLVIGSILEECLKFEQLSRFVITINASNDIVWKLFDNCLFPSFEISTESFQLINLIFLKNPKMISNEFFNNKNNLNKFIRKVDELLKHGNYVTKRQALKLLSSMILGRTFNQLMTAYISSPDNLKVIMMLLNDKSKNLQLESFHIFKVFVANPNKNKAICDILIRNKEKLLRFFDINFSNLQDMNLKQEKDYIVLILKDLQARTQKPYSEESTSDDANSLQEPHDTKGELMNVI